MNKNYWSQKANPLVSAAVLAGGLITAVLLVFLVRLENSLQNFAPASEQALLEQEEQF